MALCIFANPFWQNAEYLFGRKHSRSNAMGFSQQRSPMVQIKQGCRAAGPAGETSLFVWFAIAVAAALLISLAIAAANSGGLDRLLPRDQLFVPYFTT
jgi:hypothetical protein